MVYKKYIKRNGRVFGPYYYESHRVNGKVVNSYVHASKAPVPDKPSFFCSSFCKVTIVVLAFLIFLTLLLVNFNITGRVSHDLDVQNSYNLGEKIEGLLTLKLKEGEFVPEGSLIVMALGEDARQKSVSEFSELPLSDGVFYAEQTFLEGSGAGYGIPGKRKIYPDVYFELRIYDSESGESAPEVTSAGGGGGEEENLPEEEIVSEEKIIDEGIADEEIVERPAEEVPSEPESADAAEFSEDSDSGGAESGESKDSGNEISITGAVAMDGEIIITGSANKSTKFVYSLEEGQSAELISGSVMINGQQAGDESVSLKVKKNKAEVSTDYAIVEEGYGEDYLGEDTVILAVVNLSEFDLEAKTGALSVSFVYGDDEMLSFEEEISVREEGSVSGGQNESTEAPIDLGGSGSGIPIEEEPVKNPISMLSLVKQIPTIRIQGNSSTSINLSEYFEGAEEYDVLFDGAGAIVEGEILTLRGEEMQEIQKIRVAAYSGNESIESNEFDIVVYSKGLEIETSRSRIKLGERVKWTKMVYLDEPGEIVLELPAEAEDISVKKVERGSEKEIEASVSAITGRATAGNEPSGGFWLFKWLRRVVGAITGGAVGDINGAELETIDKLELILAENATNYVVEYYTEAPSSSEEIIPRGKKIIVSGPDNLNYTDVLSFTNIPEAVKDKKNIIVYWVENASAVSFDARDFDGDGFMDYVEWVTPHLSEQTFEIILITNAEHLDEDREFVENAYEEVKSRDGVWKEIPAEHYLRVTFERKLDKTKDITIYARSNHSGVSVRVYEKNGGEAIADFGEITEDKMYKIYLSDLPEVQDTFDLLVDGASGSGIEFDYVVDPSFYSFIKIDNCSAEDYDYQGSFPRACDYEDGYSLLYNDSQFETHQFGKLGSAQYGGVRVVFNDSSVTTCQNITNVTLCYEWWATGPGDSCDISVDANGGTSWTEVTTACPGMAPNPGITCVDVTALENWNCTNFFGTNSTGAYLKSELNRQTAGYPITEIATWSILYLKANYSLTSSPPKWSNSVVSPSSLSIYSPNRSYQFNVTWQDDYNIRNVSIEHNFAGALQNYSVKNISSVYYYNISNLAAGNYTWRMFARDNDNQFNYTSWFNYTILKNVSTVYVYIDGIRYNKTLYENETANVTVILQNPIGRYVYLYVNGSIKNQGYSPISNESCAPNESAAYNVTGYYFGDNNYTSAFETHYLIVRTGNDNDAPVITIVHPYHNQSLMGVVNLNITTDESGFCRYSTIKTFAYASGTLFDISGGLVHSTNLGALANGEYVYYIKCNDSLGNINTIPNQGERLFTADNVPPSSVTNLRAVQRNYTSLLWNWTNPPEGDFNISIIYLNDINVANTSAGQYSASGLIPSTQYTLNILTRDNAGNINTMPVLNVTRTLTDNAPVIGNIFASPNPYYVSMGGKLNFSANVTDDFNVTNVTLSVNGNLFAMTLGAGGLYFYEWNKPEKVSGLYEYAITAYDRFRATSKTGYYTIVVGTERIYVEHNATRFFNTTDHFGVLEQSNYTFPKEVETLAWNFTKDLPEDYGGLIIDIEPMIFGGGFSALAESDAGYVYIRWELVKLNVSSGAETPICSTPNLTGGALITTLSMAVNSRVCEVGSRYYVEPGSKLKVKIYGYNYGHQEKTITHYWDINGASSEYIVPEIDVGNYTARITEPSSDTSMVHREKFEVVCIANCSEGYCFNIDSWIQYHNGVNWVNVSYNPSDAVSLNETFSNPASIGTILGSKGASYQMYGNIADSNVTLRCTMRDMYNSPVYTDSRNIRIIGIDAPNVTLVSPANGSVISGNNSVDFICNATDKNGLRNMTLYWDYYGAWQKDETIGVSGYSNQTSFGKDNLMGSNISWNCLACDIHNNCSFAPANWTVTIIYAPPAPMVSYVSPVPSTHPIEASYVNVMFSAYMYNNGSVIYLNHTSVEANLSRGNHSVNGKCVWDRDINNYTANYSCMVSIWYFNEAGVWNVSVKGKNLGESSYGYNDSTTFFYYQLVSVVADTSEINFGEIGSEQYNKTALNPVGLSNAGNARLGAEVNSTDLRGNIDLNDTIVASNFSASGIAGVECAGELLNSGLYVSIFDFFLDMGNNSAGFGNSSLRFCIPQIPKVPAQNYSTTTENNWIIRVFSL